MIEGSRLYPTIEDSGVPWLGDIPKHREILRIKHLPRERDVRLGDGVIPPAARGDQK